MAAKRLNVRYFAWVRERVGVAEETVELPDEVTSVAGLMAWLAERDEGSAAAFAKPGVIRAALDRDHVDHDASLGGAREVAFFPPMTGG